MLSGYEHVRQKYRSKYLSEAIVRDKDHIRQDLYQNATEKHSGSSSPLDTRIHLVDDTMKHDTNMEGLLGFPEGLKGYKSGV
ncbi:hypothetical protein BIW11_02688 [Tropilaelaps mercedesae]|uniref:Uncharacterized protein n=1 Tax=Tropilaelaps mercedesae TaxID=418985 RepID=A0A1V9XZ06_9ACAR|nr:hypothetical protein BIW11_02688 [Tropilaelaps mercedesae]